MSNILDYPTSQLVQAGRSQQYWDDYEATNPPVEEWNTRVNTYNGAEESIEANPDDSFTTDEDNNQAPIGVYPPRPKPHTK